MHHGDRLGDIRQVERFLDRGIAAADHDHVLVAIEEAVAGGAGGDAKALELLFGFDAEPFCLGAGRDDDRLGGPDGARIGAHGEGAMVEFDLGDEVVDDLGAHMGRLFQHLLHQPGTLDRIAEARIVFDIRGDHQLAALFHAGDQNRFQHGARRIDGGRITGRAGADDQDLGMTGGHGVISFQRPVDVSLPLI